MRKIVGLILVVVIFSSCKSSFKSNFADFNAYYNTFYNAKKSFNLGEDKSEEQSRKYNTLQPIRIYETPLGAGAPEFQNAIDKGADILRKHKNTKWVDDALLIIGKSYFYRREYFSADQKFDELSVSSENEEMKQKAVFWKGRVLLELELYNQGVQYLTEQLGIFDGEWKNEIEFQVRAVLAEHYVERENWVNALDQLDTSVNRLPKKAYKERGYFLIGQINEILGNSEAAFDAYSQVSKNYINYDLQFEAQKKQAEVARALGKSDEAYKVFAKMVRDDKNSEFISDLNFELGKTEQDRGNYKRAEEIYLGVLRDSRVKPGVVTKAKVYNGLAEINRFNYNNYELAAAYYDSAAKVNAPKAELPESFNAGEFAVSFGDYSEIKNEIHLQDSLLWLGSLPREQFDSVMVELEKSKREEIARLQKEQEERRNTLINVSANNNSNNEAENTAKNGFLSYKNPVLLSETSQQFRALWNSRPLLDNWRVSSLIVDTIQEQTQRGANGETNKSNNGTSQVFVSIDLSRVPFTPQDQDSVREDIASLNYELANLFFLSLNLPDSAAFYFSRVLLERPESRVAPVSLYSLSELYSIQDDKERALAEAERLVQRFPNTIYADRLIEKYNIERPEIEEESQKNPRKEYLEIKNSEAFDLINKAEALIAFEEKNNGTKLGEQALFDGIETYILIAKKDSGFVDKLNDWNQLSEMWTSQQKQLRVEQDSARALLSDTLITTSDSLRYTAILDSSLIEPDFTEAFPYRGEYWDSTRSTIEVFLTKYPQSTLNTRVKKLQQEFQIPIENVPEEEIQPGITSVANSASDKAYISCEEIDQSLFIRGGEEAFLRQIEVPEGVQETEISFLFYINLRGIVDEFKLSSNTRNQSLIDAFVRTIDADVSFEPVLVEGVASPVSCELTFQVPR